MLILITLGIYTNYQTQEYKNASYSVSVSQNIITEAQEIMNSVQDIETAYRGFVITNDSAFLNPLLVGQKVLKIAQEELQNLPLSHEQHTSLDTIKKLIAEKNGIAYSTIVKRKYGSFEEAQALIKTGTGNRLMNNIRYNVIKFINDEKLILNNKLKIENNKFLRVINIVILSVIVSVIVILLTLVYILSIYKRLSNTENRLVKAQMRLENILDMLPVGIVIINVPLKQYHANNKAIEILGGGINNDGSLADLVLDKGSLQKSFNASLPDSLLLTRAINGEENIGVSDLVIYRNNKEIPLRVSATPLYNEDGEIEYAVTAFDDITNIKKVESDLKEATKIVEESLKLKEIFLANMSHEIRTPMNAILGFTELLARKDLGALENEFVHTIHSSGENLLRLLNDILDFSKLEANMMIFEDHVISIRSALNSIHTLYSPKALNKNIQLFLNYDNNIPENLIGDPVRLTQIITNILGNAIKFTDRGSVLLSAKKLNTTDDKTILEFKIKDSGIGIPKEKIRTVFQRFDQGDANIARQYGGTGIGLSIAKQLIELQGGVIDVTSEVGLGSIFTFTIPFKNYNEENQPNREVNEPKIDYSFLKELKILLAEDNAINAMLIENIFKEQDITLDVASNGLETLQKIRKNNYDLVLMDIEMPEMNGYETTKIIRREMKLDIPIVAMTAHALAGEKEKCLQAGMNDYLTKPVNIKELFGKIYHTTNSKNKDKLPALESAANNINAPAQSPSSLPHIAEVPVAQLSLNYLHEVSGNNKEFEIEMIEMLISLMPEQVQQLEAAYSMMDYTAIKEAAHKLKSSISISGAEYLKPYLEQLEEDASGNNISDFSKQEFADVISRLYISLSQLQEILTKEYHA